MRELAIRDGLLCFDVPANVPARYSALTPVGLLPAAVAGIDVRGLLGGAHGAAERTAGEDLRSNPAYLLAATLHVLAAARGRRNHLFVSVTEALAPTAVHLARLFEESVGAAPDEPAARRRCEGLSLVRDFEPLCRRVAAAPGEFAVVLLEVSKPGRDRTLPKDPGADDRVAGRSLADIAAASGAALRLLLAENGVPHATLRLPATTPQAVGALHMAAMLSGAFAAGLCGGRPFAADRPRGVNLFDGALRAVAGPG
ncbi:MAG: hypothetical protein IT514_16150 [Burkholderiales bacterium]|nr:hypothetical protein [Burkholderiales bacterium]